MIQIPFTTAEDERRFWSKVQRNLPNQCWPWRKNTDGRYGKMRIGSVEIKAHRLSYYFKFKVDAHDLKVCHSCDNTMCCNPRHLFLGTQAENLQDMTRKGRRVTTRLVGEQQGRSKLTSEQVMEIRRRYSIGELTQTSAARQFKVSHTAIYFIVSGITWSHLPLIPIRFTSRKGKTFAELQNGRTGARE